MDSLDADPLFPPTFLSSFVAKAGCKKLLKWWQEVLKSLKLQ